MTLTSNKVVYADPSKFTKEQQEQLTRTPINLTRMLLHCSGDMVKSLYDLAWTFRSGNLEPRMREAIILRMATIRNCSYELSQHVPAAKLAGLSDGEIAAITSVRPSGLDEKLALMLGLVDDCAEHGKVTGPVFEVATVVFTIAEIAEATLLSGLYDMVACFIETMGVEIDQHPLNWKSVDKQEGH